MADGNHSTRPATVDDPALTAAEVEAFKRETLFADPLVSAQEYPRLWNLSAGMLYQKVVRAEAPESPDYVTVLGISGGRQLDLSLAVTRWNLLWEAAQFRRRMFAEEELPPEVREVANRGDVNVVFVPRTRARYHEYAPLFHLLPRSTVERHGLPLLRSGQWPFMAEHCDVDRYLPADFPTRLERAWAAAVWRHLMPGSPLRAFSASDPVRLLAHNLDFWLPPVTAVMQDILRSVPVVDESFSEYVPRLEDGTVLPGVTVASPRVGPDFWRGEAEAAEVLGWAVEEADADGRLRAILDAVRAHRVADDFSEHWSYAREDFERKLYRKRSKIRVSFVELTDAIPVQGPETEIVDKMVFADFLALLDERERQVVVLLHSGMTKIGDVATALGYKNHSPVSKRLAHIRRKAEAFFDER